MAKTLGGNGSKQQTTHKVRGSTISHQLQKFTPLGLVIMAGSNAPGAFLVRFSLENCLLQTE